MNTKQSIPQPKTYGPLGNLPLINKDKPTLSLCKLAEEHGGIFRFETPSASAIMISNPELAAEVCDESRFDKSIEGALEKVRAFSGDGLFTSRTNEPNWKKAHNILMPTFSQRAMKDYHLMMVDIASQLVQKWARLNRNETIDVPDDMTRLTLDTIGLCGFNYRFNSYYRDTPHPFITSMVRALDDAMHQMQRLDIQDKLMVKTKRQFQQDIKEMYSLVDRLIAERKDNDEEEFKDLLSRMLNTADPDTGEMLDDENIRFQIITFLIAGHETTSGMLSFAIYYLIKNPEKLEKAYEEVDRVFSSDAPSYKEVTQLNYIRMILNESLRLWPTAPAFSLNPKQDTVIGGKYPVKKGERVTVLIPQLHRDKDAWGENAESFVPERFEDPKSIPRDAYKPFGNGQRACIGMQFALHEATLVLGMILKQFRLIDHSDYELDIKQTLTLKPGDFHIKAEPREKKKTSLVFAGSQQEEKPQQKDSPMSSAVKGAENLSLLLLYGSDMGTAEGVAYELGELAGSRGIQTEVASLNDRAGNLPNEGAVIIVTSSYNGKPPRNAGKFVEWLNELRLDELNGIQYAVFGCGDQNWASTYQDIPRQIDEQFSAKGAKRFIERGEGDASGDFEEQFDSWKEKLWANAIETFNLEQDVSDKKDSSTLHVEIVSGYEESPLGRTYNAVSGWVAENSELQLQNSGRNTRHLEIRLPEDTTYQEGDHLGVLPQNSDLAVSRVLKRFHLNGREQLILSGSGRSTAHFPLDRPVNISTLLQRSVELQDAASRSQIKEIAAYTVCPPHKHELEQLTEEETYKKEILSKRVSMLDLLEKYMACEMPFERFLMLLRPLKPRYYSISSSPRKNKHQASITVSVVRGPAWSGKSDYFGVATNYLAGLHEGDEVQLFIRTPETHFQLPDDPATPIIMVGPGTGIAPFRGFLQAREQLKQNGEALGEAHLYFGCRNESDHLYKEELESYEKNGIVTLNTAYSRHENDGKTYVQHLMAQHREKLITLLEDGGRLYICGDGSRMAVDVEKAIREAYQKVRNAGSEESAEWLKTLEEEGRFAKDVWAGV
ncbi:bifunctional cytochrome P450/NADPH--P450 reductase [Jeotgalibacillus proteolyticus]|uniref:Bifunctional cytochrome P450/NADPH--P450 reductase n=1 Tax=Jeotgalibacillus proteolyticus TaxID=2082395 RepID=A0A2S5G8F8_9BACL|nr:bifunctional cytochrome P450/NADPH--P450 reductase [Jeotgalibacillus proteolyticus]PPA69204.1 NADPH--cytochrome reductase [Jeotgalibacillus proteolyticus]